jgi:hypothetical protein
MILAVVINASKTGIILYHNLWIENNALQLQERDGDSYFARQIFGSSSS